jgi:hypothetical protein
MANDHTRFLALAQKLIAKDGQSYTFNRDKGLFNPATGDVGVASLTSQAMTAVVLPFPKSEGRGSQFSTGVLEEVTKKESRLMLVAPLTGDGFTPENNDRVAVDGSTWAVVGVIKLKPRDVTVLYKVAIVRP